MKSSTIITLGFPHATGLSAGAIRHEAKEHNIVFTERTETRESEIVLNSYSARDGSIERATATVTLFLFDDGSKLWALPEYSNRRREPK